MAIKKLADHHRAFIDAYIANGGNATEAYKTARPASKANHNTQKKEAGRWRKDPLIADEILRRQAGAARRADVTLERVIEEIALIGFANIGDYMRPGNDGDPYLDFSMLTPDQTAALAEVVVDDFKDGRGEDARDVRRIKFKMHDKLAALVKLGQHLGGFKERVELTGRDAAPHRPPLRGERRIALAPRVRRGAAERRPPARKPHVSRRPQRGHETLPLRQPLARPPEPRHPNRHRLYKGTARPRASRRISRRPSTRERRAIYAPPPLSSS